MSNKLYALMQMYGLRMKRGASIQDHLRQLDELADHLTALDKAVSELDKVAVLLRSVQESYPTLVTVLLARGDDELTLLFVKQALLDEAKTVMLVKTRLLRVEPEVAEDPGRALSTSNVERQDITRKIARSH